MFSPAVAMIWNESVRPYGQSIHQRCVVNIPVAFSGAGYRWRQEGDFEAKYHDNIEEGYLFPEYGPAMLGDQKHSSIPKPKSC